MDGLDIALIVVCFGFGLSGYRQGFVIGFLSFAGFLGGGALGAKYANSLHSWLHIGFNAALFGLLVVILLAVAGQLAATLIGTSLRREMKWGPLRTADAVAGGAVSVLSVLLVAWLVGTALANTATSGVSREVRHSAVLRGVDQVMPTVARTWFGSFRRLLDQNLDRDGFPAVFGGLGDNSIVSVAPPNPKLAHSRVVRLAEPEVVKIRGVAGSCSRQLEGSGFVYAPDRVMTNAHVLAGVTAPTVETTDGTTHPARVVLYDPERDVAVLFVPGLGASPLSFSGPISRGQSAIVLGYPEDGPFTARAARVRSVQNARGPDIYQNKQVTRQIYSLYSIVRPGNSGGPLLTTHGQVAGIVFAAAVDNDRTGYALTAAEVAPDASKGESASAAVSTQQCD
jgi:S1-C subfamily serine protease